MSELLWSFDQLARFTRYEDPEVRCWAAERLIQLFPEEAADVVAELLMDDHDTTPELVAEFLGRRGAERHVPRLIRGFRRGTGHTPSRCLEALARLGHEGAPALAETTLHSRDVPEHCLAVVVGALAEMGARTGRAEASDRAREFLLRRPELFAEAAALRGAILLFAPADFGDLVSKWITSLHFRGATQIETTMRVLIEELQLEDFGWCMRTGRDGRIDLERTLKAIESGYDIEVRSELSADAREELALKLERGEFRTIVATLGAFIRDRAAALPANAEGDPLAARLAALGAAFTEDGTIRMAAPLDPAVHQWVIGLLIAGVVKVITYRNYLRELTAAGEGLDPLLALACAETSCLLTELPARLAAAVKDDAAGTARVTEWCVRTLEARGPFFSKAIALETLGEIQAADLIPEIVSHLADDNAYIYGAAERALARMGEAVIPCARGLVGSEETHPDAMQSLTRIICEMGRESSLQFVLDHLDVIFETIGPEAAAESAGLLGHRDLAQPLRRWLDRAPALAGHALLLIGALNNIPVPEEDRILKAIDEYWKGSAEEAEEAADANDPSRQYLM